MSLKRIPPQPVPPAGLAELQQGFMAAITTPLGLPASDEQEQDRLEYELQIEKYPLHILRAIEGDPARKGRSAPERLAAYNQQYWFRLLTVMQREHPLLRHLLGITELNRLSTAYLTAHPSRSPYLRDLGLRLAEFLASQSQPQSQWSHPALIQCARLEARYIHAFDAAAHPVLVPSQLSAAQQASLLTTPLRMQPHWSLFTEDWELVRCRQKIRTDHDDEISLTLDMLDATLDATPGHWALYRAGRVQAEPLGPHQHRLLSALSDGASLQAACDALAASLTPEELALIAPQIQGWFARWVGLGWFCALD